MGSSNRSSSFSKLLYLALVFLIQFTAFNSISNLISRLYEDTGYQTLGKLCLFFMNIASYFSSFAASSFITKLGMSRSLLIGASPYLLIYLSGLALSSCSAFTPAPSFCESTAFITSTNIFAFVIVGISSSLLWTAQSGYMSAIAPKEGQGTYLGIFMTIVQISWFIGNLLPSIIFRYYSSFAFFLLMSGIGLIGNVFMMFVQNPDPKEDEVVKADVSTTSDQPIQQANVHDLTVNEPTSVDQSDEKSSISDDMKRVFMLAKGREIRPWIFFFLLAGLNGAFISGFLYKLVGISFPKDTSKERLTSLTAQMFMMFGVGELTLPYLMGRLVDSIGTKKVACILISIITVMTGFVFAQISFKLYSLCLVIAFLAGASDACFGPLGFGVISKHFGGSLDYFALGRAVGITGTSVGFIMLIVLDSAPLIVIVSGYAFCVLLVAMQLIRLEDRKHHATVKLT